MGSISKKYSLAKKLLASFLPVLFCCVLIACHKETSKPVTPTNPVKTGPDIYVIGNLNTSNGGSSAVYWKNGTMVNLSTSIYNSSANTIAVVGKDVYIGGSNTVDGKLEAVYWKNGVQIILGDGTVNSLAFQGNDIYAAGYSPSSNSRLVATYWKNGVATQLPNPIPDSNGGDVLLTGIAVDNNDIYLVGYGQISYGGGHSVALYWKNGKPTLLTSYFSSFGLLTAASLAYNITLNGNDVYIAGTISAATGILSSPGDISGAVYWKNGTAVTLTDNVAGSSAQIVAFNGADIYIAGANDYGATGGYWKNNVFTAVNLGVPFLQGTTVSNKASGFCFYSNDMYVSGYAADANVFFSNNPGYWKNGIPTILRATMSASTTGIAVVAQ